MRNCLYFFAIPVMLLCLWSCGKKKTPSVTEPAPFPEIEARLTPEQQEIKQLLEKNGAAQNGSKPTVLVVKKLDRRLTVYRGLTPIKTYPVVLGQNPRPDKLCQGDLCTPEGVYHVVSKFDHPRWDKFILLDYPNMENWIKFARAKNKGVLPPTAQIGGEIGIHGTHDPSLNLRKEDWTLGCVSLLNQHIEEIYPMVDSNTLVYIKKR